MKTHGVDFAVGCAFHGSSTSIVQWARAASRRRLHPQGSHFIASCIPPGGSDGILLGCSDALKPILSLHHRSEGKSVNRMVRCEPRDLLSFSIGTVQAKEVHLRAFGLPPTHSSQPASSRRSYTIQPRRCPIPNNRRQVTSRFFASHLDPAQ